MAFDPLANTAARAAMQGRVEVRDSLAEGLRDASTVLVATPDETFRRLGVAELLAAKPCVTVVDCWRILDPALGKHAAIRYIPIGHGADPVAAESALRKLWSPP